MKDGKLVYGFNCGSGEAFAESDSTFNDGQWHTATFSRTGNRGSLKVDDELAGEVTAFGSTKNIEVDPTFYLGNVPQDLKDKNIVVKNLKGVTTGFVGCLKDLYLTRYEGYHTFNP